MKQHDDVVRAMTQERNLLLRVLMQVEERWPDYLAFEMPGWRQPGGYLGHLALLERHFLREAKALAAGRDSDLRYMDDAWRDRTLAGSRPRTWSQLHASLARSRADFLGFVARCSDEEWRRAADHPSIAPNLRPRGVAKMIARHDYEHREELERLLSEAING
jgi:hypothetical protein